MTQQQLMWAKYQQMRRQQVLQAYARQEALRKVQAESNTVPEVVAPEPIEPAEEFISEPETNGASDFTEPSNNEEPVAEPEQVAEPTDEPVEEPESEEPESEELMEPPADEESVDI